MQANLDTFRVITYILILSFASALAILKTYDKRKNAQVNIHVSLGYDSIRLQAIQIREPGLHRAGRGRNRLKELGS